MTIKWLPYAISENLNQVITVFYRDIVTRALTTFDHSWSYLPSQVFGVYIICHIEFH